MRVLQKKYKQNKNEVRERMMVMIEDWKSSGLKQKHYCVARNIAYHVFHYWYGVYRMDSPGKESFLPVKIKPSGNEQQVIVTGTGGVKVELILNDASVHLVQQLLRG